MRRPCGAVLSMVLRPTSLHRYGAVLSLKGLRPDRNAKIHVDQAGPRTRQNQEQKAFITAQINIFNVNLLQGLVSN